MLVAMLTLAVVCATAVGVMAAGGGADGDAGGVCVCGRACMAV